MINMRTVTMGAVLALPFFVYAAVANTPYCSMSASSTNVSPGTRVRLVWNTANATYASIAGIGQVATGQSYFDVYPYQSTTYTMTAANTSGSRTCAALIMVVQPQPVTYYAPIQTSAPINIINTTLPVTRNYSNSYYGPYFDDPYASDFDPSSYDYEDSPTYYYSPSSGTSITAPGYSGLFYDDGSSIERWY